MVRAQSKLRMPDYMYQTTRTELFKPVGKQFKRKHPGKHEERRSIWCAALRQ